MTEGLKWTVNHVPGSDDKFLDLMSEENVTKANEFHKRKHSGPVPQPEMGGHHRHRHRYVRSVVPKHGIVTDRICFLGIPSRSNAQIGRAHV